MSQLLRVRPTKIELIRLRRRLRTSLRVHKILNERLTILVNEFMATLREAVTKRHTVYSRLLDSYRRSEAITGLYGSSVLGFLREAAPKPRIYIGTENIMGVKVKVAVIRYDEVPVAMPSGLEDFVNLSREVLLSLVDLAKMEHALYSLGREIASTKRKANALQYIVIPRLRSTIRYLQLKFDEREREERARVKRIKQLLTRAKSKA